MSKAILAIIILFSPFSLKAWDSEDVGDIGQYAIPLSAMALTLAAQDFRASFRLSEEYSLAMGVVHILKPLINEKRPNLGNHSFPSGHTASAFSGAAFIQSQYGWKWGVPAYIAACFVGYSRVKAKKHWAQDVCAGASISIATHFCFDRNRSLLVTPYYEGGAGGFAMQLSW